MFLNLLWSEHQQLHSFGNIWSGSVRQIVSIFKIYLFLTLYNRSLKQHRSHPQISHGFFVYVLNRRCETNVFLPGIFSTITKMFKTVPYSKEKSGHLQPEKSTIYNMSPNPRQLLICTNIETNSIFLRIFASPLKAVAVTETEDRF